MTRFLILLLLAFPVFAGPIMVPRAATVTISCTSSSSATALPTVGLGEFRQIELSNAGTVAIFMEFGASTAAAAVATGYPILPGQTKVVTVSPTTTHIACIVAATTTTLYATVGIGE
jgi:hypothetical protein